MRFRSPANGRVRRHLGATAGALALLGSVAAGQTAPGAAPASGLDALAGAVRQQLTAPGVARGTWGIAVQSLQTGDAIFEHNAHALLVPASVAKLVPLAATVESVGWEFRFETELRATGPVVDGVLKGDLVVRGSGDPSIGSRGFAGFPAWTDALRQMGITRIEGRLIGDDDALEEPRPGAMWSWDDLGYPSGAIFGALNYAENRLNVTVRPGSEPGAPTSLVVDDLSADRPLVNRSLTASTGTAPFLWPEQRPGETALTIAGSLPAGSGPVTLAVSAGDPTRWFVSVLRREMQRAGIEVSGGAVDMDDVQPRLDVSTAALLHVHRSPPLRELARPLLKDSVNLYAEAVMRQTTGLAGGRRNDDALAALAARMQTWGLPPDGLQIVDGSGLSRRNGLTAATLVGVLTRMFDGDAASPWMTGLPMAGRDGLLMRRFRGTAAEGNLRAKTGTMSNIRSLAGYVTSQDGEPFAFAIILNGFEGTGTQAQTAVDRIAVSVAEFTRR
jgi:D-alanyl-D-alanine carboxypeptidase/D-alanyl-D-alanine-endopeptidase (penicillin-binding protein 4)